MTAIPTFWDRLLEKCAGKGAYYQLQTRLIEAEMSNIEAPSNPSRPSKRFERYYIHDPVSTRIEVAPEAPESVTQSSLEIPHARTQAIRKTRLKQPKTLEDEFAEMRGRCIDKMGGYLTVEEVLKSPLHGFPQSPRDPLCNRKYPDNSNRPFYPPAINNPWADVLLSPSSRPESIFTRANSGSSVWSSIFSSSGESSDTACSSQLSSTRRKALPMQQYVDDEGVTVQVGFTIARSNSSQSKHAASLAAQPDRCNSSARVPRVSIEDLESLQPIKHMQHIAPSSQVPVEVKKALVKRLTKQASQQKHRINVPKRSQSAQALLLKNARGSQNGRRPSLQRRVTIAETHEEAENAIEDSDDEPAIEQRELVKTVSKEEGKTKDSAAVEKIEDMNNSDYIDVEEEKEKPHHAADGKRLTHDRLTAERHFNRPEHVRHAVEKMRENRRKKSTDRKRAVGSKNRPGTARKGSNNSAGSGSVEYKPSRIVSLETGEVIAGQMGSLPQRI